jgi:hypothetical protein
MDAEALAGLRLPGAVEAEVERAMGEFVRHVMERDTRSRRFLEEVKAGYGAGAGTPPRAPLEGSVGAVAPSSPDGGLR